jgi:hypothetical protein
VVDNISVQLLSAGLVGAFYTDAFYTTTDDWTARLLTVWAGRPAKGAQLTSWENGSYMVLTASSSSAWKTYAAAEINGDGFMSLCMEDVGIDPSESQRQSYYGAQPDNHPILTISYHHELLNAPSNCEEAKAQGYQSIADLDGDCYVNISDLAIFVQRWLK